MEYVADIVREDCLTFVRDMLGYMQLMEGPVSAWRFADDDTVEVEAVKLLEIGMDQLQSVAELMAMH